MLAMLLAPIGDCRVGICSNGVDVGGRIGKASDYGIDVTIKAKLASCRKLQGVKIVKSPSSVMEVGCGRENGSGIQAADASIGSYGRREEVTKGFVTIDRLWAK